MLCERSNVWRRKTAVLFGIYIISNVVSAGIINDKFTRLECTGEDAIRLEKIRNLLKDSNFTSFPNSIAAYIVPTIDAHNSEYVGERDARVKFLTKFSGSVGTAVITEKKAALWIDSRYHLQAEQQVDENCWIIMKIGKKGVPNITEWINEDMSNLYIGLDPFLESSSRFRHLKRELSKKNNTLISIKGNLVDVIWDNQPPMPDHEIFPLELKFTGRSAGDKIANIREKVRQKNATGLIVSALDDIAWLLNLRGSDIPYNPVFYSYLILTMDDVIFFVNKERINDVHWNHFRKENVTVRIKEYDDILNGISDLVSASDSKIIVPKDVNQAIYEAIPSHQVLELPSVIALTKTIKNEKEAKNIGEAHIRDGLALIRFLHWMETTIDIEEVTELSAAAKLDEMRSEQENFKGLSFETISAFGSHAAMAHYPPSKETDSVITRNEIYLVDSGGQYLDGTTDVTRTMHFGQPTAYEMKCFTLVLKGFIALVTSVFPVNTSLNYFDCVARRYLKQAGLNYGHGTGHGVGAFLNVHEYPPLINSAGGRDPGALENMFTSNEPGYYEDGQFGIRLEDVIQVIKSDLPNAFTEEGALTFKTVTFAPIQTKMIDMSLFTKEEESYINEYHQLVLDTIGPLLLHQNLTDTYEWLVKETSPILTHKV